ncbi:MAG: SGNH/GDSL hydrolase family protein [Clostridia bacterium]|nr:SGNH/GDSL hydrolase family protein [Clostridia bacterium]
MKISFLGDSITEGVGVKNPENLYHQRIKSTCRLRAVCIDGISGSRFAAQKTPTVQDLRADRHFISRVENLDADSDVIVVFGGTNDYGHGDAPLGEEGDRSEYTFRGACDLLFEKLIERFPDRLIVVMGPLHRSGEDDPCGTPGRKSGPVGTLYDYAEIIRKSARKYAIPYLDLMACSGMTPRIPAQKERYMPDGLHPNDAGHEKIARLLIAFLENLI